jgi:Xaa-Pro aminopeptidase
MANKRFLNSILGVATFIVISVFTSCDNKPKNIENPFSGPSPWPEIRKERIRTLLAPAMQRAGVSAWAVLCRDNHNDPIAAHVGGENAGAPAVFYFELRGENVFSIVFTPPGEAIALKEKMLQDSIVEVDYNIGAVATASEYINKNLKGKLALNFSTKNEFADGLSFTQFTDFTQKLNTNVKTDIVSSEELLYEWLSVKLPAEVEIMRKAAEITSLWEIEALKQVVPNKTRDVDIAIFLKEKMKSLGVTDAWSPDQNPSVNSGIDRGHSHATDKIIRPGDVIQIDFGIRVYDRWVSDIQRFAYVLKPGEIAAPADIQRYWEVGKEGNRKAKNAMKPGISGYDVDKAQRMWMAENNSQEVFWGTGHSVGYQAHDVGPRLSGNQAGRIPPQDAYRPLLKGQIFAFDGFYKWNTEGGTKTISVEEMAVVTENGAEYISPLQEDLVLIKSKD